MKTSAQLVGIGSLSEEVQIVAVSRRSVLTGAAGIAVGSNVAGTNIAYAANPSREPKWGHVADVVVAGSGAAGLAAAIVAREAGASVIVVEAEPHFGGRAIVSTGNIPLGGGTPAQREAGIDDSPDLLFRDLTDWSIVQSNGFPSYRYNDREIIRAFSDNNAAIFDFLVAHGVVFTRSTPDTGGGTDVGNSVQRMMHAAVMNWPLVRTGQQADPAVRRTLARGDGFMRPLEAAARAAGIRILLSHRLVSLHRTSQGVAGIKVGHQGREFAIRARRAVVVATGGSSGNVNFRRMFDPRLTEEYCGVAGEPYSKQDASGILAAMDVGASLWGLYNETGEFGTTITKPGAIGTQYNYTFLRWEPNSIVFPLARAVGLQVSNFQDLIHVNMIGKRFYDETGGQFTSNNFRQIFPYTHDSYLNARNITYNPRNWLNAALAGIGDGHNGGGPIWAIFDSDAVTRENWDPRPPFVDPAGFFFEAGTLAELASKIVMPHQRVPMPPATLVETVERYNSFVDTSVDADFGKPAPRFKIARPPFYAAWSTPVPHDTRSGIRINASCQVIDFAGQVIPGLYAAGECAGGFSQHGNGRALTQGYIAGRHAAAQPTR